jgi:uncharacterized protein (DUF302 family)
MNTNAPLPNASADLLTTKTAHLTVSDAVARLTDIIAGQGLKLFAVIDHSREARAAGLELRDTKVVIFGSPEAGTPVMQRAPLAALDLPLKVLVWADGDETKITYTKPAALASRYDLPDDLAARLAGIDAVTNAVID